MKIGTRIATAGLAAVALTSSALALGTDVANASTTGNGGVVIAWQPDANSLGNLYFYDAAGHQITSGSTTANPMAAYYVSSAAGSAFGHVATTTPETSNSATWAGTAQITSDQAFPAGGLPGDLAGFGGAVVSDDSGKSLQQNQLTPFPNGSSTAGYQNLYEVRMYVDGSSADWYAADIQVSGTTWTQVFPNQTAPSVTVSSTETSPQPNGTLIHLTATLGTAFAGKVQFYDGVTALGTPVAVSGTTANKNDSPANGSHSYTAKFIPTPGTTGLTSTSAAYPFTIAAPPVSTTIAFVSQSTGTYANDNASFTVHVTAGDASNPAGSVVFKDGATTLGNGTAGPGAGDYTYSTTALGQGSHQINAQFLSANTATYANSNVAQATPFSYLANSTVGSPDPQSIKLTVIPGIVTITTPYPDTANAFDLGNLGLNPAATLLVKSALFPALADNPITITDTRAGDLPWHATLTSSDFIGRASSSNKINGQNFGFAPDPAAYPSGNSLNGKVVVSTTAPAAGVSPTAGGTAGLKGGPTFAQVFSPNSGVGTAFIRGQLSVQAPTSTVADTYDGVITFTVIGS